MLRADHDGRTARPATDHFRPHEFGRHFELRRKLSEKAMEITDVLAQAPENQKGTVAGKRRRLAPRVLQRIGARFVDLFIRILSRVAEDEFARPEQILSGLAL